MSAANFDPLLLPILSSRCRSITREMSSALMRSARCGVINGGRDFSSALLAADGRALMIDEGLPVHVGSAHLVPEAVLRLFDDIQPGDCFLNNSPYFGNTHHADFTYSLPVFADGELLFWVLSRAHQTDVGAPTPSTYLPFAASVQEEGLHLPCVRVRRENRDVPDMLRLITEKMRLPDLWYADYLAQVGSLYVGERELLALWRKYGTATIRAFVDAWIAYGDRLMAAEIAALPAGTWSREAYHDALPYAPNGIRVVASMTIEPTQSRIVVDLRDNDDNVPGGMNLSEATTLAAVYGGILNNMSREIPRNAGSLGRITVLMREGAVVGIPRKGVGTSVATTNLCDRLFNVMQAVFAEIGPPYGIAEGSTGMLPNFATISGHDRRRGGAYYMHQAPIGYGGGPGLHGHDGWLTYNKPATGGVVRSASVEINEMATPVLYRGIEVIADSGGAGRWEGAPSVRTEYGPRFDEMTAVYVGDSCEFPPRGVCGGRDGNGGAALRRDDDGEEPYAVASISEETLAPGETLISIWPGGGGYGEPRERDPLRVLASVEKGWTTIAHARMAYGVVIRLGPSSNELQIDWDETAKLRGTAAFSA